MKTTCDTARQYFLFCVTFLIKLECFEQMCSPLSEIEPLLGVCCLALLSNWDVFVKFEMISYFLPVQGS